MDPALTALLTGVLDYAGIFPPAKLPLDAAFRNFIADRNGPHSFMLARFVCPATRLLELAPMLPEGAPVPLSVLVAGEAELPAVRAFLDAHGARAEVSSIETKLPADLDAAGGAARKFMATASDSGLPAVPTAFEATFAADWTAAAPRVARALAEVPGALMKVRCGGEKPAAYPTPRQLGAAVAACRDAGLRLKATAGLHHPLRGVKGEAGVTMHGFLNLFLGGAIAMVHRLADVRIAEILASEDPRAFWVRAGRVGWGGLSASAADVARARGALVTSFGSCSFAEPVEDLAKLGWLPGGAA